MILNTSQLRSYQTEEERLIQLDESLQDLGKESEATDQVLFALESPWVEKNEISPDYVNKIQELCDSLSLQAVGFVLASEALLNHLLEEDPYRSTLVLYQGTQSLILTVLSQGKQLYQTMVGASDNIVLDFQEALARLDKKLTADGNKLPLNIVLASASLSSETLKIQQQQLATINWTQDFNFIQAPLIEMIAADDLLELIVKQGGLAVAKDAGVVTTNSAQPTKAVFQSGEELSSADLPTSFGVPIAKDKASGLGEALEAKTSLATDPLSGATTAVAPISSTTTSGLVTTAVAQSTSSSSKKGLGSLLAKKRDDLSTSIVDDDQETTRPGSTLPSVKDKQRKIKIIVALGVIVGLLITLFISYFVLQANYTTIVNVWSKNMILDKELVITLDSSIQSSDPQLSLLKAQVIDEQTEGSDSRSTTGIKVVGEKAQGEIRIFNKTDADKTFGKGTILTAGSLEFALDEEVTISAATTEVSTSGDSEKKVYGQKEVKMVAIEIGAEGNLTKDTSLKVESYSDDTYSAQVLSDLEGGSSREIRVVSQEDQQELLVGLRQRLLKEARETLAQKSIGGKYIQPTELYEIVSETYSAQIGDEVDTVSLTLALSVQGLAYMAEDLTSLAREVLAEDLPEKYQFVDEDPEILSQLLDDQEDSDQIRLEAKISARVKSMVESDQVAQSLTALTLEEARDYLSRQELIDRFDLSLHPEVTQWLFSKVPSQQSRVIVRIDE